MTEKTIRSIRFLTPEELKHSRPFFELSLPRVFPWFLYGVGLLLLAGFLWAAFGQMEVIVKASVVLRPKQNVSELKSALTGLVTSKYFSPGQQVKEGDLLWALDSRQLAAQKEGAIQQKARSEKLLADVRLVILGLNNGLAAIPPQQADAVRKFLLIQKEEKRLTLLSDQAQRDWDLERTLPKGFQTTVKLQDLETAAEIAKGQLESFRLNQRQNLLDQENSLKGAIENLNSQLASLEEQLSNSQVRSPLAGWVEDRKSVV